MQASPRHRQGLRALQARRLPQLHDPRLLVQALIFWVMAGQLAPSVRSGRVALPFGYAASHDAVSVSKASSSATANRALLNLLEIRTETAGIGLTQGTTAAAHRAACGTTPHVIYLKKEHN